MEDYYEILGIDKTSNSGEIKKAYRKLSIKNHPDRGGNPEDMKKINAAYHTLGDDEKKRMYDMQKNNPMFGAMSGGMPGGMPGGMMGNPEDILNMMFGGGIPFPFPGMGGGMGMPQVRVFHNGRPVNMPNMNKPTPIVKSLEITLEQAYTGLNYPLKIEKWVMEENVKKIEHETIYVDIKAGIDDSEIIILRNRGNMISDTNIGDIKLFIKVINNTEFVRDGLDILLTKNITLKEALIGFQFDFKHLSGKTYTINNKPGKVVTPDFVKEVANMGMKRTRAHPASPLVGNLLICFNIKYPETITEEQCKQLAEIL
uniref:J domain-containing protein n=1 Tax=viral metagenome TaxID=1070528 RepID=A0A6C0EN62_9ZZZZ